MIKRKCPHCKHNFEEVQKKIFLQCPKCKKEFMIKPNIVFTTSWLQQGKMRAR